MKKQDISGGNQRRGREEFGVSFGVFNREEGEKSEEERGRETYISARRRRRLLKEATAGLDSRRRLKKKGECSAVWEKERKSESVGEKGETEGKGRERVKEKE
ncbi:hypothetical protein I3760_08G076000 [Carya illinoinensis]|nr:hypothetical protein I3760_08G076000 [Carya illinoinensis]